MTDIELVIKLPEEIRLALINNIRLSPDQSSICDSCIKQAIINGTPLPKDHGRLIDVSDIEWAKYRKEINCIIYDVIDWDNITTAPTIIQADKMKSENKRDLK